MVVNSLSFLWFFLIILVIYYICQTKRSLQNLFLLGCSYWFYSQVGIKMAGGLAALTLAFWFLGKGVSHYLDKEDERKAAILTKMLLEANPDNIQLLELDKQLKTLAQISLKKLSQFTATDVKGNKVSDSNLRAKLNVVTAWASWNYQSTDMQKRLKEKKKTYGDRLAIVSICIDGNPKECKRIVVDRDSLKWPTVCDGKMWKSPLFAKFGFSDIPSNVVIDSKGNIIERNLTPQKLDEVIDKTLKDKTI